MITCPGCNARLDVELPPDRGQANNLVPEPARPSAEFASTDMVLALEAIYAAIADMEEFVNSSTHIHYNRRAQLRAKTAAVKEAVQIVRQNGEHSNTPTQNP